MIAFEFSSCSPAQHRYKQISITPLRQKDTSAVDGVQ